MKEFKKRNKKELNQNLIQKKTCKQFGGRDIFQRNRRLFTQKIATFLSLLILMLTLSLAPALAYVQSHNLSETRIIDTNLNLSPYNLTTSGINLTGFTSCALRTNANDEVICASDQFNVSGSGVANAIAFWNTSSNLTADSNLTWDNTNKFLGIGTVSPSEELHVVGNVTISDSLLVRPSAGDVLGIDIDLSVGDGTSNITGYFNSSRYGVLAFINKTTAETTNGGAGIFSSTDISNSVGAVQGKLSSWDDGGNYGWMGAQGKYKTAAGTIKGFLANGTVAVFGDAANVANAYAAYFTGGLSYFDDNVTVAGLLNLTGNLTIGTSPVFLDGTNGRMGVNTNAPDVALDIETAAGNGAATIGSNTTVATGDYSVSLGNATNASGRASMAFGEGSNAVGDYSIAFGYYSNATNSNTFATGLGTRASGLSSVAMGEGCSAEGMVSFAAGYQSNASAIASVAIGYQTKALAGGASALGYYSIASGDYSTVSGFTCEAAGRGSTASGFMTNASAFYATAFGYVSNATGESSVSMGNYTLASGAASFATGTGTSAQGAGSFASGVGSDATGNYGVAMGFDSSAGTGAFTSGYDTTASSYAVAQGYYSKASSVYSVAMGSWATASGDYSVSMGSGTNASNDGAVAFGRDSSSSGQYSFAAGFGSNASDIGAVAFGAGSQATNDYAFAAGSQSEANGKYAFAMGDDAIANANYCLAFGYLANASNTEAIAIGNSAVASGTDSIAMGQNANASANFARVFGIDSTASALHATAIGYRAIADGDYAIAIGENVVAGGQNAFVAGENSVANGTSAVALGDSVEALGQYSVALGYQSLASASLSFAAGYQAKSSAMYATAFGREIEAGGDYNFVVALSDQNGLNVTQDNTMAIMGGNVGIGTAFPDSTLHVNNTVDGITVTISDVAYESCTLDPGVAATWICPSDRRLKTNIRDIESSLDDINALRPVRFDVISTGKEKIGFIAQEVLEVVPEAVETRTEYLGMSNAVLVPKVVKAVQELNAEKDEQIQEQQKQIDELKALVCLDHPDAEICDD